MSIAEHTYISSFIGLQKVADLAERKYDKFIGSHPFVNRLGQYYTGNIIKTSDLSNLYRLTTVEGFWLDATAEQHIYTKKYMKTRPLLELKIGDKIYIGCGIGSFGADNTPRSAAQLSRTIKKDLGNPTPVFSKNMLSSAAFLIGLFRGSNLYQTRSESYAQIIQLILLNYGIYTKIDKLANSYYQIKLTDSKRKLLRKHRLIALGKIQEPPIGQENEATIESIELLGAGATYHLNTEFTNIPFICNGILCKF